MVKVKRWYSRLVRVFDRRVEYEIQAGHRPAFFCPPGCQSVVSTVDGSGSRRMDLEGTITLSRDTYSSFELRAWTSGPVNGQRDGNLSQCNAGLGFTALGSIRSGE